MTEQDKKTLQKICKKTGDTYIDFFDTKSAHRELNGLLLDHETTKAVFGDDLIKVETIYDECGHKGSRWKRSFDYHTQQLSLLPTYQEKLKYYRNYL